MLDYDWTVTGDGQSEGPRSTDGELAVADSGPPGKLTAFVCPDSHCESIQHRLLLNLRQASGPSTRRSVCEKHDYLGTGSWALRRS